MMRFLTIFLLFVSAGCGFLDEDIFLDDEAYEKKIESQSYELEAMSISGSGAGGYSFSHSGRYSFGRAMYGMTARRSRTKTAVQPARALVAESGEEGRAKKVSVRVDTRPSFIQLVDNYGDQTHTLHLP